MWRMILPAGASMAALASTAADAASFVYTGNMQTYPVTQPGIYVLCAAGAQGGGIGSAPSDPESALMELMRGLTSGPASGRRVDPAIAPRR
jgi:hypothetical protein